MNKDEINGKARQITGAIKENLGWLTDDHKAEDEGRAERIKGIVEEDDAKERRQADETEEELAERAAGVK